MWSGHGRRWMYVPGVVLEIPADFSAMTCLSCHEVHITDGAEEDALNEVLKPLATNCYDAIIETARGRAFVSIRQLEQAAGVRPGYLRKVADGKEEPSLQLIRLLEAFARYPAEVKRHLEGGDWFYD